jgi:hypothetical protein
MRATYNDPSARGRVTHVIARSILVAGCGLGIPLGPEEASWKGIDLEAEAGV